MQNRKRYFLIMRSRLTNLFFTFPNKNRVKVITPMSVWEKQPVLRVKSDIVRYESPLRSFDRVPVARESPERRKSIFIRNSSVVNRFRSRKPRRDKLARSTEYDTRMFRSPGSKRKRTKGKGSNRDQFELPTAFVNIIFEDKEEAFVANYILRRTSGTTLKQALKSMLEVSIVENCSSSFIFTLMRKEIEQEGLLPIETIPQITIQGEGNRATVSFTQKITEYHTCLAPQAFIAMKCSMLIKRLDNFLKNRLKPEALENLDEIGSPRVNLVSTSVLNRNHQFYQVMSIAFPEEEPIEKLATIYLCVRDIFCAIEEIIENHFPFDVTELLNKFGEYATADKVSKKNRDNILFWCFFYPIMNLTPIATRRRTKIPTSNNALLAACFLVIKRAAVIPSGTEDDIFSSICHEDEATMDSLRKSYQNVIRKFSVSYERDLGDTVLHFCSVSDDNKPLLMLCELFSEHIDSIWDIMLNDPTRFDFLLMNFVPFIRSGFNEL